MRAICALFLSLLAAPFPRAGADPWSMSSLGTDCRPEDQSRYDGFEQDVRHAAPGSTLYVPKPYPTTDREVVLDFLYQYQSLHREKADPKVFPEHELPLLNGILDSTVTFTVQRVENWTPSRCGREQRRDYFNLLRVLDAASGAELARVALNASGLWSVKTNTAPTATQSAQRAAARLPDPETALRDVAAAYKIQGDSPQYVTTAGTIYCHPTAPCLAFRQGRDAFIRYKEALFQISGAGPRLVHGKDVGTLETSARVIQSLRGDERLVSLGGAAWTIAREVKAFDPRLPRP